MSERLHGELAPWLYRKFGDAGVPWSELSEDHRRFWLTQTDLAPIPAAPKVEASSIPVTLAAVAHPGDTLLIGFERLMADDEFQDMCDRLRPLKDQLGIQIVLIEGASSMVVGRRELDVNGAPMRRPQSCPYTQSHTREFCGNSGCRER